MALVAMAVLVWAAGARAANTVEIVSPRPEALVTSKTVKVRIRVTGRIESVHVYLSARRFVEISRRLRVSGAGVRTVTLRVGRDLVIGRDHLFAQVRWRSRRQPGGTQVHFTVGRRSPRMLRVTGTRARHAPVVIRARAPRADVFRITLNGHSVAGEFPRTKGGIWIGTLAADNGLHFGRNRVVVTAFNRQGAFDRVSRAIVLPPTGPLVGAGPDVRVVKGAMLRLDGRSTVRSRRDHVLRLGWTIVSKPPGAKAKLIGAATARPRLRPDVSGRYVIKLCATETPGGPSKRRSVGAARAATAADTVTVTAQPDVPPSGIPITTLVSDSHPGVTVGNMTYSLRGGAWLQMLVLDRSAPDAAPIANNSYPASDSGMAALAEYEGTLSPDDLVVLSGSGQPASLSAKASENLVEVVTALGGVLQPGTGNASELASGQWSLIGVPGVPQGEADQSIGLQRAPAAPVGSMSGLLQQDASKNYTFTWPASYVTFDTQAPGTTPTQNVIAVDAHTYSSAVLPVGQAGLHVVSLDAGTLAVKAQFTVATTVGAPCGSAQPVVCLSNLASYLEGVVNSQNPALVLVSAIGNPAVSTSSTIFNQAWATVAQMLATMGAQQFVLLGLNGTGGYSFVGDQGFLALLGPNSGTELSQSVAGSSSSRLTGLLERDNQGSWAGGPNGSPGGSVSPELFQPSLRKVLAQPAQPFPAFNTPGELAAEKYVFAQLFPSDQWDSIYGIRALYWEDPDTHWNDVATSLGQLNPCTRFPCAAAYQGVKKELITEFGDVDQVRGYFAALKSILNSAFGQDSIAFTSISQDILGLYNVQSTPKGPDAIAILGDVLSIASGAAAIVPGAGGVSGGLSVVAGMAGLIDQFANNGDGGSALDPGTFQSDMNDWGQSLITAWGTGIDSLDQIAGLLVSDWGRLQAAVNDINTPLSSPPNPPNPNSWELDDAKLTTALSHSATQYMWQTMLPAAVDVANWVCYAQNGPVEPQLVPPLGVSKVARFNPNWVTQSSSGYRVTNAYLFPVGPRDKVPSDSLLQKLFSKPTASQPDNLGLQQQYFWAGAWLAGNKPVTPGFAYSSPMTNLALSLTFAPTLPPPGHCLPAPS